MRGCLCASPLQGFRDGFGTPKHPKSALEEVPRVFLGRSLFFHAGLGAPAAAPCLSLGFLSPFPAICAPCPCGKVSGGFCTERQQAASQLQENQCRC